jgi:hypothetical protein
MGFWGHVIRRKASFVSPTQTIQRKAMAYKFIDLGDRGQGPGFEDQGPKAVVTFIVELKEASMFLLIPFQ